MRLKKKNFRNALYFLVFALYLSHNDVWFWNNPQLVLGFPVGLLYHIGFCLAASVLMGFLVFCAWPENVEVEEDTSK